MTEPRILIGAPVAERGWVLPRWFECLAAQSLQPVSLAFVYSESDDGTLDELRAGADKLKVPMDVYQSTLPFYTREQRNDNAADPHRARHFSVLRNQLRSLFLQSSADFFFSLDTDILLQDEHVLSELLATLRAGWDAVCPLTYLHPWGERSKCYNAGFLGGGAGLTQVWRRADESDVLGHEPPVQVQVPLAAVLLKRGPVAACAYKAHELGEDVGFGQSMAKQRLRVGWRTDLVVEHVWDPSHLEAGHAVAG